VGVLDSGTFAGRHSEEISSRLEVDVLIDEDDRLAMLRAEARRGLTGRPKELPPKWFYDERGSALFDDITRLPEYYLTRCERAILRAHAREIAALTQARTLVELGSGTSDKTRLLLDALDRGKTLRRFVPFDVCLPALQDAASALLREYPRLDVHAVAGDFDLHIGDLPREDSRPSLVAFLGSTIGNFGPGKRGALFGQLRRVLGPSDFFLLGTDLVKDPARLNAAYNDAQGVTAAFNRNVLRVLNRDLDADFIEDRFEHLATYDATEELIDIRLRSRVAQVVTVSALDLRVAFAAGEEMRTEISTKFRRAGLERELGAAGFELISWWTDRAEDFAVSLWAPDAG
jgi:L-histidine N-alpha-methyltransferase